MFPPPKAENYKIDPGWKIQPGAWISHVPNKEAVGNVDRYHQHVLYWEVLKGNEIGRQNNELLRRLVAQMDETREGTIQRTDASLQDNAASKNAADKGQDLSRAHDHNSQPGQQAPMLFSEPRAGTQANIDELKAKIHNTIHPASTEVPGASTPNLLVTKLATDSQAFVQKFSERHIPGATYRLKKADSLNKHWRKNSPKGQSGQKAPLAKPRETNFNAQPRSATAGQSASPSPLPSQATLRMPPPSAPQDDGALAPFKRRFQSSPSQASQAPSVPGPSKEGGQQPDAA
ncbi:MAG: hypothetical protein Q9228_007876, partial [Teloschistes exilis]